MEPGSVAVNSKVGVVSLVGSDGTTVKDESRARPCRPSRCTRRGRRRRCPAASMARTWKSVAAVGEQADRLGARAHGPGAAVETALEGRARLARRELEGGGVVVGRIRRRVVERRVRRGRVDRPRVRGGRRVGEAGRVRGAHLEGVAAVGEARVAPRARARRPRRRRRGGTRRSRRARSTRSRTTGRRRCSGCPARRRWSSAGATRSTFTVLVGSV